MVRQHIAAYDLALLKATSCMSFQLHAGAASSPSTFVSAAWDESQKRFQANFRFWIFNNSKINQVFNMIEILFRCFTVGPEANEICRGGYCVASIWLTKMTSRQRQSVIARKKEGWGETDQSDSASENLCEKRSFPAVLMDLQEGLNCHSTSSRPGMLLDPMRGYHIARRKKKTTAK